MRIYSMLFLVSLVWGCLSPVHSYAARPATESVASDSQITNLRNSDEIVYSFETYAGMRQFSRGHTDKAYAIWVEEGWKGDIDALALAGMVCVMEEVHRSPEWKVQWGKPKETAPVCPVPAKFWEDALVKMLGEGEGSLLLGLFGMELMENDPYRKGIAYAAPIEAFMLRSAMAGNADGMYGAYYTGGNRSRRFTPPKNMLEVLVLPEKYEPDSSFEKRYWLAQSARGGNIWALEGMAIRYRGRFSNAAPDVQKSEEYYVKAMEHGTTRTPSMLSIMFAIGDIFPQDAYKAICYAAFAALINENGELVEGNKESNRFGYALALMKKGFKDGDLHYRGERRVFEPCLTEVEYQKAVSFAHQLYEKAKASREKEQAAHDALYAAARAKLPEIQAAYQKAVETRKNERLAP